MKNYIPLAITAISISILSVGCKKEGCTDPTAENYSNKAKIDNGTCTYVPTNTTPTYSIPTSYIFKDANGNNTVNYSGQTERLNQLREMMDYIGLGTTQTLSAQDLLDMYANTGGDGNGNFSFSSTKQLKDKTFAADQSLVEQLIQNHVTASQSFAATASSGQAGTLTTGTRTYLLDADGKDNMELIEKLVMGAVFMHQALNVYFEPGKIDLDNTTAVDAGDNKYYTLMQHSWDEAFGYFGVDINFPTVEASDFWGEYCSKQNATLNSNADMMNAFLKGRAAIGAKIYTDRDAAIQAIRKEWEEISANQAITYLTSAINAFGNDNAKFMHVLSEAYGFCYNLRFASVATRKFTPTEHTALMNMFDSNFWNMSVSDINAIKAALVAKY